MGTKALPRPQTTASLTRMRLPGLVFRRILEGERIAVTPEKLGASLVLILIAVTVLAHFEDFRAALGSSFFISCPVRYAHVVSREFCNWWLYGMLSGVLAVEWLLPAQARGLRSLVGLRQDFIWALFWPVSEVALVPLWVAAASLVYNHYLWFLTIPGLAEWPWWARVILTLLVVDFVMWLSHLMRHKVPLFWDFHTVHHSQTNINFFTEHRVHPIDSAFVRLTRFIPMMMVAPSLTYVVTIEWLFLAYRRMYHSNIRTNLGVLRYLLVTPQSHRIHHSNQPRHRDRNFGLMLSVWDHMFGTQYRGYQEYPDTGIEDSRFPGETGTGWLSSAKTLLAQMVYPFRRVAERWSSR